MWQYICIEMKKNIFIRLKKLNSAKLVHLAMYIVIFCEINEQLGFLLSHAVMREKAQPPCHRLNNDI